MVKTPPSNVGGEGLIPGQGLGSHMLHSEFPPSKKKKDAKELMKMILGKNEGSYSLNTIIYLLCNKQWYLYCG